MRSAVVALTMKYVKTDAPLQVKQASILEPHECPESATLQLIRRMATDGADQRIALMMVIRGGSPETWVLDADWLEFALETNERNPSLIAGMLLPPAAVRGFVDNWPSLWVNVDVDEIQVELHDTSSLWRLSFPALAA